MRSRTTWLSLVWLLAAAGCGGTGTDLNQVVNENPLPDGGNDSATGSGDAQGGVFQDPFGGAPGYAAQTGPSSHNAGKSCLESGCHGSSGGIGAPSLLIGGTVYKDYQGKTPAVGVEVRIVDTAGHAASVYSGPEGNFYLGTGSAQGVTFPAVVGARDGTTTRPMITTLTSSMASCGQTTCHAPAGGPTTNTGNYYPIHLP